jgi:hypothetical protein
MKYNKYALALVLLASSAFSSDSDSNSSTTLPDPPEFLSDDESTVTPLVSTTQAEEGSLNLDSDDIVAEPTDDRSLSLEMNDEVNLETQSSSADSNTKETPDTPPPAPDEIKEKAKSILAKVQGDGKLSASTKESFGILVTDELFAAIKSKEDETAKRITEDELIEVIESLEAAAEQKKKSKQEQKDKEAAKMKVDPAPPVDSTNLAKPNAEGGEDLNGSSSDTTEGDKAEVPFYMNAWIMVPSGIILLSVIGGGVFMMTRKTDDNDL